ncbi:TlpA disulfide reductase family protein [soil metagenome]
MGAGATVRPRLLVASLLIAAVVGIGGGLWWGTRSDDDTADATLNDAASVGEPLPDVEVLDIGCDPGSAGDLVGRPLVVNLWYTACAPCRREMPALADAARRLDGEVRFVGINTQDDVDTMVDFAEEIDADYELLRDPDFTFFNEVRVMGFPTTFFVDSDGTIVAQTGEVDADELQRQIDALR